MVNLILYYNTLEALELEIWNHHLEEADLKT